MKGKGKPPGEDNGNRGQEIHPINIALSIIQVTVYDRGNINWVDFLAPVPIVLAWGGYPPSPNPLPYPPSPLPICKIKL